MKQKENFTAPSNMLVGPRVVLRALNPLFFADYLKMFSKTVRSFLGITDIQSERLYLKSHYEQVQENKLIFFCIFSKKTEQFMGAVEIRPPHYKSQLYNWLNEQFWSHGFMQESLTLATHYYFMLHPDSSGITACVNISNIKSIAALERFGFEKLLQGKGPREDQIHMILKNK